MKTPSLENSIYDINSKNSLLQKPNVLVTPYAKENITTTIINSPSSSSNDEHEDFSNDIGKTYYPASTPLPSTRKNGSKRRSQVRNACVNCQKACKKCDEGRPCQRCIKLGITDTCVDSPRKERKKGFKRGPYRKRSVTTQPHIIPKRDISAATTTTPLFTTTIPIRKEENVNAIKNSMTSQPQNWSTSSSPIYNEATAIVNYHRQSDLNKLEPVGYYNLPPDNTMYNNFDNAALIRSQCQQRSTHDLYMTTNQNNSHNYATTSIPPIENYNTTLNNTPYVQQNQVLHVNDRSNEYYQVHQRSNGAQQPDGYYDQMNATIVSSPEDLMLNSVPTWAYTDSFESQLYYNTQTTSQFVPKLGDNAIVMITPDNKQQQYHQHQHYIPNSSNHHENYNMLASRHSESIYHVDQEWVSNSTPPDIYYYPTSTRYNNDYY